MRAVLCREPGRLEMVDRPSPSPEGNDIAVNIRCVGVCGTDFHIFLGKHPFINYPLVLGHELSGIVAAGSGSDRLPPGTPVVINPYLSCGTCIACRRGRTNCCTTLRVLGVHTDGGMCERIVMPESNLYPTGELSLRDAAMVEFLCIGAHAVGRSQVTAGSRVIVVGLGPIGVGTALFAREAGADVTVMDVSEDRLDYLGDRLGFRQAILAGPSVLTEAGRLTGGDLFDVVFDATGNARSMEASFALVAHTGTLVFVGVLAADISFSDGEFHKREMRVLATRNAVKADFEKVMAAIAGGRIPTDAINTHSDALDRLPEAMPAWLAGRDKPLKAVLSV